MIEIRMETKRLKLTVKGHAMPAETEAYKEICSAVSALAQSMVYAVTKYKDGAVLDEMQYRPDTGDLMVHMRAEEGFEKQMQQIWELYGYGMELLAQSHPMSVTMIWDGARVLPEEEVTGHE